MVAPLAVSTPNMFGSDRHPFKQYFCEVIKGRYINADIYIHMIVSRPLVTKHILDQT